MKIGRAINTIRKKKSISQLTLAQSSDITQAALSQIENDIKKPSDETLEKICKVLGVTKSLLFAMSLEEEDVPAENKELYEKLFPSIQNLVFKIIGNKEA